MPILDQTHEFVELLKLVEARRSDLASLLQPVRRSPTKKGNLHQFIDGDLVEPEMRL